MDSAKMAVVMPFYSCSLSYKFVDAQRVIQKLAAITDEPLTSFISRKNST